MISSRWLALGLLALAVSACQATARVAVTVTRSGAGAIAVTLTLDPQAAARVGDLGAQLSVADLRAQGWTLAPTTVAADGSATATLRHTFANPTQADALLGELGPAQLHLTRSHGFVSSREVMTGTVDLRSGIEALSDATLAHDLGAPSLTNLLQQVQAGGAEVPGGSVEVVVQLPGRSQSWPAALGQVVPISLSASTTDRPAEGLLAIALLSLSAAVVLAGVQARRRPRHHDHWSLDRP